MSKPNARTISPFFRQSVGRPLKSEADRRRSAEEHADDIGLLHAWRKRGDHGAFSMLVERHMGLVGLLVNKEFPLQQNSEDLMQEGVIGLIKGLEKYDVRFGTKITTYVSYWIRAYVLDHLMRTSSGQVHMGRKAKSLIHKISRARHDLRSRGEPITHETIAKAVGITVKQLSEMGPRAYGAHDVCLDDEESFVTLRDHRPSPETAAIESDWQVRVRAVIDAEVKKMRPLARKIIRERFFMKNDEPRTLQEIGDEFGLSRERIRQIERDALAGLRRALVRHLGAQALHAVLAPAA